MARDSRPGYRILTSPTAYRKHTAAQNTMNLVRHLGMALVLLASYQLIKFLSRSLILQVSDPSDLLSSQLLVPS